jgi:hypothetical protein
MAGHGDLGTAARAGHRAAGMAGQEAQAAGMVDPPADPAVQAAGMAEPPVDQADQVVPEVPAVATAAHRVDHRRAAVDPADQAAIKARRGPGCMNRRGYLLFNPAMPKPRLPCWVRGIAPG